MAGLAGKYMARRGANWQGAAGEAWPSIEERGMGRCGTLKSGKAGGAWPSSERRSTFRCGTFRCGKAGSERQSGARKAGPVQARLAGLGTTERGAEWNSLDGQGWRGQDRLGEHRRGEDKARRAPARRRWIGLAGLARRGLERIGP